MLIINSILLALYATIGASAPTLNGARLEVEPQPDKPTFRDLPSHNPMITNPKHLNVRIILESIQGPKKAKKADKTDKTGKTGKAMKGKAARKTTATKTTKGTARLHVRRNNNAQEGSGKISLLESIAQAIGIDPKSISEYINNLRNDFPVQVGALPTCLNQATRESLTAIEASLSSIPKCLSATGDEIEIDTDGVEIDADGLPVCLDEAGQNALESIQNALIDLGDCATATPLSRT
ncbi:uncharacterized protein NECHADRAFT_75483 [Fusarium vanettenii 77-13-4]|uniref:Uncharacterized protein n=1 Tax=Fusarium vanettenii (strain ATCC MYA-4622 / CBS 123669 / FGSC 9596 / NRRL 45880 / 77-13-4) TaxID=660122 RepID=C7YIY0_FUSV7|nr:uncharacterized protein NECHADRAFT_75483 [Fusarium vanettenii 77-13-4]EEU48171.1 predicted protein [Fusarium vanettenii 77-13-4]